MPHSPQLALELERLKVVRELAELDFAAHAPLNDLLRMAAHALACPMAAIGLLGTGQQWLKLAQGLEPLPAGDFLAFCSQAARGGGEVFVVGDARLDARFAAHPLVTGPLRLRFYAGVAIELDGHNVGTLLLADRQARTASADERALLRDLAQAIAHSLAAHRERHGVRAVQQRQHRLLDQLPVGLLVLDDSQHIVHANPTAERLLGRGLEALLLRPLSELMTGGGPAAPDAPVSEWDCWQPDGRQRRIEATAGRLADGRAVRVLRDVSQRQEEMAWLRKLSQAAEQASEAIVITDLAANIEYVNQAAVSSSGYAREELVGRNSRVLQSGMTPATRYRRLWSSLTEGRAWRGFLNNRRKDGSLYVEFAVISPVRDPDGRITHYLAVKEDITEKRRMGEDLERYRLHLDELVAERTRELESARRAAETANAAKSAFLAAMSHEIRTPMNGVIGLSDLLLRSSLSAHQRDLTGTLREAAQALLSLIDDILDFSKIEAGRLALQQAPVALRGLVEKASDTLLPLACSRGVKLHTFLDPALPTQVLGDAHRLRQIILNLVGNAIKFSAGLERRGRVALRVLPDPQGGLCLEVSDNGIGMSAEVQQRIFKPFVQGDSATASHYGGTGLGLVICQRLAVAMGGHIRLHSAAGAGATFGVQLPLAALTGAACEAAPDTAQVFGGLQVELWLDDAELAHDWAAVLRAAGAQVAVCDRAPAPPAGGASTDPGRPTLLRFIGADQRPSGGAPLGLPIVWVHEGPHGPPRVVSKGQVALHSEGLHRAELLQAVALAVGRAAAADPVPVAAVPDGPGVDPVLASRQGRLILVAEDNEINQKLIQHQLELLGLASELAADGQQALDLWRAAPQRYGLLLTDLQMPRLDGLALAAAIRQEETSGQRLPVIALTANVLGGELARCLAAGMDGYLGKPVEFDRLRDTLLQWLPEAETPHTPASNAPAPLAEFDDALLERLVGPDEAVLRDLRQRLLASLDVALPEIGAAVDRADWMGVGMVGHRLKSSSHAVGALALGRCMDDLERAGRAGDGPRVRALQQGLGDGVERARAHFQRLSPPPQRGLGHVLCVDDEGAELLALQTGLAAVGAGRIETFGSGAELLDRLSRMRCGCEVLVLLDLHMPQMDGMEVIRHLAQRQFRGALALTSSADPRVVDTAVRLARAHQLRWVGTLPKPVSPGALTELLQRCAPAGCEAGVCDDRAAPAPA